MAAINLAERGDISGLATQLVLNKAKGTDPMTIAVAAAGGRLAHRRHPGADDNRIAGHRGLKILNAVRPDDPAQAQCAITIGRPALGRGMGQGRRLHPLDVGHVAGVAQRIDLAGPHGM